MVSEVAMAMEIIITRVEQSDLEQIEKIQIENQRSNLNPLQQKDGFLSIAFSREKLNGFNDSICIAVAKSGDIVTGYCCISSAEYNSQFPILDQIVANLSNFSVPGSSYPITKENTSIYGPVCVAAPYRNRGILKRLSSFARIAARDAGYRYCFSFISPENVRSLDAHIKLSFLKAGKVHLNNKEYIVMASTL